MNSKRIGKFEREILPSGMKVTVWYNPDGPRSDSSTWSSRALPAGEAPWELMEVEALLNHFFPNWKTMTVAEFNEIESAIVDEIMKVRFKHGEVV